MKLPHIATSLSCNYTHPFECLPPAPPGTGVALQAAAPALPLRRRSDEWDVGGARVMHRLIHRQSPVFMIHNQTITDPQSLEGYGGVDDCLTMCLRCFFFIFATQDRVVASLFYTGWPGHDGPLWFLSTETPSSEPGRPVEGDGRRGSLDCMTCESWHLPRESWHLPHSHGTTIMAPPSTERWEVYIPNLEESLHGSPGVWPWWLGARTPLPGRSRPASKASAVLDHVRSIRFFFEP